MASSRFHATELGKILLRVAAGLIVVAVTGWALYAVQPRLTAVTEGVTACVPANSEREGLISIEVFRNDTSAPITVTSFEPAKESGLEVIGAYFVPDGEPGPEVQNDPALVPHGFSFDPVPPGHRVTLAVGLRLANAKVAGRFTGGTLRSDVAILSGGNVGTSSMGYRMAPTGQTCDMK